MAKVAIIATCLLLTGFVFGDNTGVLIDLDEDNWRRMLDGEWMVEFFAPWCPACKTLAPTWESYAKQSKDIRVAKVDVTKSPALSGRFFVTALPTIFHVMNGEFRQYRGSRDVESLTRFVVEQKWKSVEPVSAWKNPASVQMSLLSYFFKLSHLLKDINTKLQNDYGVPTWGSYVLFAIATIFLGAILGLMLVCIVDFLYPPKNHRQSFAEVKQKELSEGGAIEDIPDDELEDESEGAAKEKNDEDETSEGERNSGSDNDNEDDENEEDDENIEKEESEKSGDNDSKSSPQVRKRKTRKAD